MYASVNRDRLLYTREGEQFREREFSGCLVAATRPLENGITTIIVAQQQQQGAGQAAVKAQTICNFAANNEVAICAGDAHVS